MKITAVLLTLTVALAAAAQQPAASPTPEVATTNVVERQQAPTYSDVYCAGFITDQPVSKAMYVAAGWDTPNATKFADRDYVYLTGGGFQEGQRYAILRHLRDPNRWEGFRGQRAAMRAVGQPYAEVGRVRVIGVERGTAITVVEFACQDAVPGDIAVPFAQKDIPQLKPTGEFDRFVQPSGRTSGRIVMAKEFDTLLGNGHKVYLNVGANQGVKVGDYFRAYREYNEIKKDEGDALAFKASQTEDTQNHPPKFSTLRLGELPRMNLGEMIVISTTPSSATAMITRSIQDIHTGDGVEAFEPPPPPAPVAAAPPQPPIISCFANPATVRPGETSTITCEASSPENRPLTYAFESNGGQLYQRDNLATLNTGDTQPGAISVRTTVTDDRNQSAMALTNVNVEAAPAAPAASKINEFAFKPGSARVDNAGKAILDDVALQLQRDPNATAVIMGYSDQGENKRLAERRANNAKNYLTTSGGIDPARVAVQAGTDAGKKADIWLVPAGAQMPQ